MPSTVNGIGTHYYGKKNLEKNIGVCERCQYHGELLSYETRLWFVVFFIPVIPLGRKQVNDYCPKCTCHRLMDLDVWHKLGDEEVEKALAEYDLAPDDPKTGIRAHSACDVFHRRDDAQRLAEKLVGKFPEDYDVQMYLGAWFERNKQDDQADACFERALKAKPDDLFARRAVGFGCAQKGDLGRARKLLSFMEEKGKHQDTGVLYMLARKYQEADMHNDALDIFEIICRDFPLIAKKDKKFRKTVAVSEKAASRPGSMLPRPPAPWGWIMTPVIIGLIGIILVAINVYLRTHQTVYIINQLPARASIVLAPEETEKLGTGSLREVTMSEGKHSITIDSGLGPHKLDIEISNSLWERFTGKNTFVINVGGGAVLMWQECYYSASPDPDSDDKWPFELYVGKEFLTIKDLDYVFEDFPDSIQTDSYGKVYRTRLTYLAYPAEDLVSFLEQEKVKPSKILDYLETHILHAPTNKNLLYCYLQQCTQQKALARGIEFLRKGLSAKPVNIEWHRCYQILAQSMEEQDKTIVQYDMILDQTPNDSALIYLRGRIDPDCSKSIAFMKRAIAADDKNAYAWYTLGNNELSMGKLREAEKAVAKACELSPNTTQWQDLLFALKLANGDTKDLTRKLTEQFNRDKLDYNTAVQLFQLKLAKQDRTGANKVRDEYFHATTKKYKLSSPYYWARTRFAYLSLDRAAYFNALKDIKDPQTRRDYEFDGYIAFADIDKVEEAIKEMKVQNVRDFALLELWVARQYLKPAKDSDRWLNAAKNRFGAHETHERRTILRLLNGNAKHVLPTVDSLPLSSLGNKAVLCLALARIYPAESQALIARAKQLNIEQASPYQFVKHIIDSVESGN